MGTGAGVVLNGCCQLVTHWLCHLDPVVPQLLGSPGPILPTLWEVLGSGPVEGAWDAEK